MKVVYISTANLSVASCCAWHRGLLADLVWSVSRIYVETPINCSETIWNLYIWNMWCCICHPEMDLYQTLDTPNTPAELHGLTAGKPTWGYEIRAEMPWKKCVRKWQQAKQNCTDDMSGSHCHCTDDHHFLSPTRGSCPASSKIFSMAAETSPSLCSVLLLFHRRIRLKLGTSTIRLRPKKLISLLSPSLISLCLSRSPSSLPFL